MILESIYRYPVKGFSPDKMDCAELQAGCVVPFDRRWSLAFGGSEADIDPTQPKSWVGQRNLLSLSREPRGAQLQTEFSEADGGRLEIKRGGRVVAGGALNSSNGRNVIESFLDSFYANTPFRHFRVVENSVGAGFTDWGEAHVSLINLGTVRDIERVVGAKVDPLRFRGNLYVDAPAWVERGWVGKVVTIGGVELGCYDEIERCRATSVSLATGEEDINIPLNLKRGFGHMLCGVYLQVKVGGEIRAGETVVVG